MEIIRSRQIKNNGKILAEVKLVKDGDYYYVINKDNINKRKAKIKVDPKSIYYPSKNKSLEWNAKRYYDEVVEYFYEQKDNIRFWTNFKNIK